MSSFYALHGESWRRALQQLHVGQEGVILTLAPVATPERCVTLTVTIKSLDLEGFQQSEVNQRTPKVTVRFPQPSFMRKKKEPQSVNDSAETNFKSKSPTFVKLHLPEPGYVVYQLAAPEREAEDSGISSTAVLFGRRCVNSDTRQSLHHAELVSRMPRSSYQQRERCSRNNCFDSNDNIDFHPVPHTSCGTYPVEYCELGSHKFINSTICSIDSTAVRSCSRSPLGSPRRFIDTSPPHSTGIASLRHSPEIYRSPSQLPNGDTMISIDGVMFHSSPRGKGTHSGNVSDDRSVP